MFTKKQPAFVQGLSRADFPNAGKGISPEGDAIEYFFAGDASAVVEHTNRVIFLEDDDVAAVKKGVLSIHG